jgi:hypothetical protein
MENSLPPLALLEETFSPAVVAAITSRKWDTTALSFPEIVVRAIRHADVKIVDLDSTDLLQSEEEFLDVMEAILSEEAYELVETSVQQFDNYFGTASVSDLLKDRTWRQWFEEYCALIALQSKVYNNNNNNDDDDDDTRLDSHANTPAIEENRDSNEESRKKSEGNSVIQLFKRVSRFFKRGGKLNRDSNEQSKKQSKGNGVIQLFKRVSRFFKRGGILVPGQGANRPNEELHACGEGL